jgi:hypothetical protein
MTSEQTSTQKRKAVAWQRLRGLISFKIFVFSRFSAEASEEEHGKRLAAEDFDLPNRQKQASANT